MIYYRCFQNKYPEKPGYEKLLKILDLESLESRRNRADLSLFHNIILGDIKINQLNVPTLKINNLRSQGFALPLCTTNSFHHSFFNRAARVYQKLPNKIKDIRNIKTFRSAI